MKEQQPDERKGTDKKDHLLRSIANNPKKLKSERVKQLLSKKEIDAWFNLEGKVDTLHLGS